MSLFSKFTKDLTQEARQGKLLPAYGCDHLIARSAGALTAEKPAWVLIVGPAAAGKTRLVQGLAHTGTKAAPGDVLGQLSLLQLDLQGVVATSNLLEEVLHELVNFLRRNPQVVLVIDDAAALFGIGDRPHAMQWAQAILEPPIRGAEFRCVTALDDEEYRQLRQQQGPIPDRVCVVPMSAFNRDRGIGMLAAYSPVLQQKHNVLIDGSALNAAATLPALYTPDKAGQEAVIDLLDRACIRYNRKSSTAHTNPELLTGTSLQYLGDRVSAYDVVRTIEESAGVNVQADALNMKNTLAEKLALQVPGQKETIFHLVSAIVNARFGFGAPFRPAGLMVLWGPATAPKRNAAQAAAFDQPDHFNAVDSQALSDAQAIDALFAEISRKRTTNILFLENAQSLPGAAASALVERLTGDVPALRHLILVLNWETNGGRLEVLEQVEKRFSKTFIRSCALVQAKAAATTG